MQPTKSLGPKLPPMQQTDLHDILYIDDDRDILTITQFALEKIGGFHVETCNSGGKGLAAAEAMHPDLIMLDVMMPDVDGPSLLRSIQNNRQLCGTPVVFMTARMRPAEIDRYAALGAVGIIPKPFNPVTLSDDIRNIWQTYQRNAAISAAIGYNDLRQQYLKNLPAKRTEVEAFLRHIRVAKPSQALATRIEHLAHNLAGSGETYGYRALGKAARVLEEILISRPNSPKMLLVASRLIAAIDRTLIPRH